MSTTVTRTDTVMMNMVLKDISFSDIAFRISHFESGIVKIKCVIQGFSIFPESSSEVVA
jgi:hypothetical protein